jgi:peptidoglycan/LPS O-acetylase OafA/YrhL
MPNLPDPVRTNPGQKIKSLESIRGLAALLVVIHHVPAWNANIYDIRFIRNCYLLVDLFFVLSGFVIYYAYADKMNSWRQLLRFQFLRLGRLYPVHLFFLAIWIIIEIAKYLAQARFGLAMPNTTPFKESNFVALIEQIFLVQAIGPTGNALTFNSAAWSISVEFYTYLIFALTVLYADKIKHIMFAAFVSVSLVLLVNKLTFGSTDVVRCIAGFFTGCLTAALYRKLTIRFHRGLPVAAFLALIAFLQFKTDSRFDSVIYILTVVLILTVVSSQRGWFQSLLNLRVLTWLGAISYSVYMSHGAVIWVFNQIFRVALHAPVLLVGDRITPQLPLPETAICYAAVVLCVLVVSEFIYKLIEDPFRQKSRSMVLGGNGASQIP